MKDDAMRTNDTTSRKDRMAARLARAAAVAALVATAAQAATFELVSRRTDGTAPGSYGDGSSQPAVTPDGRYVVFTAGAVNLVTPSVGGTQVYLRDRLAGTTELVSVNTVGDGGNSSSENPSISDDGCRVVFSSFASDLVAGDTGGLRDVFVRSRCGGPPSTSLVGRSTGGTQGNGESFEGRITPDGTKVAFISYATNLATLSGAGLSGCLYVRDLDAGTTTAVTKAGQCIASRVPDVSYDGSRIAFWSLSSLVPADTNNIWDIYLYDFNAAEPISPVSTTAAGAVQGVGFEGTSTVTAPAISRDGGYVAFRSRGVLTADITGGTSHVYLKEIASGTILLVSRATSGALANADSAGSGSGLRPALSDYAGTVSFLTNATNLAAETGGTFPTVVTHDPRSGVTSGYSNLVIDGVPGVSAGGTYLVAYSGIALDPAFAIRGMFLFIGNGDGDGDGIPNAVEFQEGRNALVKDNDIFTVNRLFAMQQYRDFLGREGDAGGIAFYTNLLATGAAARANVIESFFNSPEFSGTVSPIVRLYFATFLRIPDYEGLQFQVAAYRAGTPLTVIANNFSASGEFQSRYGALTNGQYVALLYQNVLGRTASQPEIDFHVNRLNTGATRGEVMVGFSESPEYVANTFNEVYVTMMYVGMLRRAPEQAGFDYWLNYMDTGNPGINLILGFLNAPEYSSRFLP